MCQSIAANLALAQDKGLALSVDDCPTPYIISSMQAQLPNYRTAHAMPSGNQYPPAISTPNHPPATPPRCRQLANAALVRHANIEANSFN